MVFTQFLRCSFLYLSSRSGEADVRVKGPCKMQPGHYFFIDGRHEEWPEVWWCDQICQRHERWTVWGQRSCFSRWLSLGPFFFLKKKMVELYPYQKRWNCLKTFGIWRKTGEIFLFQLFLMAQNILMTVQLAVRDLWCQSASGQRDQAMIGRFIGKCNQKMEDHVCLGVDLCRR